MSTGERDPEILHERILFGGLTALFSLLGMLFPPLFFVCPVPLGVLTYRQGMRAGIIVAFLAVAVTVLFLNPVFVVSVMLFLSLGLAIGGGLREGLRPVQVLLIGSVVALIVQGVLLASAGNALEATFQELRDLFGDEFGPYLDAMRLVIPSTLVTGSVALAFLNMWGIHRILARRGQQTPWLPPFHSWRLPAVVGWVFVGALASAFLPLPHSLAVVLFNVLSLLSNAFFVLGLSVVMFHARRWGIQPRGIVIFLLIFFFVLPLIGQTGQIVSLVGSVVFSVLGTGLGLIDTLVNLRRGNNAGTDG